MEISPILWYIDIVPSQAVGFCSRSSTDRMMACGAIDGGSNPPGSTCFTYIFFIYKKETSIREVLTT